MPRDLFQDVLANDIPEQFRNQQQQPTQQSQQMNAPQQSQKPGFDFSATAGKITDPLYNALMAAGSGANKVLTNQANSLVGAIGGRKDFFKPGAELHHPGISADAGDLVGRGIPYVAESLGNPAGFLENVAFDALYGASQNPENMKKGAEKGGYLSAALNSIPLIGKGAGKVAETFNPIAHGAEKVGEINQTYQDLTKNIGEDFKNSVGKFENYRITTNKPANAFTDISENTIKKYFSPDTADMVRTFLKKPTLGDAHELQSQIGYEIRKYENSPSMTPAVNAHIQHLKRLQGRLTGQMDSFLRARRPDLADLYKTGKERFAKEIVPFRKSDTIEGIAKGLQKESTPKELMRNLSKLKKEGSIPAGHPLEGILGELESKQGKAALSKNLSALLGGVAGSSFGLPGAASGLVLGKLGSGPSLSLAQNPEFIKLLQSIGPTADISKQALLSQALSRGQ